MGMSLEDLQASEAFGGRAGRRAEVTFLPEPEPRERWATIVSVDDHVVEPPDAFADRFPAKYRDLAPRVVATDDGGEAWLWNGELLPNVGFNAVAGRPSSEYGFEPTRFDEMRRGAWDVQARLADMDVNGVWGSLCFPSFLPGFVGQRLTTWPDDEELAFAAMRAYNDWHLDAWCGAAPDRFVPNQITWLRDPFVAADEIRRNAARGFRAVTFSEAPEKLGLPSLHTGYWDPLFAACEETETVVCLHVGSSGSSPMTAPDAPPETVAVLFFAYGMYAAVDWLYSKVPVRFPNLRIALSEGGIGWVAGLIDRLDHCFAYQLGYLPTWRDVDRTPSEVLRRNFWFCAIDDTSGFLTRDVIGVDHLLVESDYPHADSTWPDTQPRLREQLRGVPDDEVRRICWQNAVELFRMPTPPEARP
jgi:predicted TIM-barrel fold metal-dependent hydrolase